MLTSLISSIMLLNPFVAITNPGPAEFGHKRRISAEAPVESGLANKASIDLPVILFGHKRRISAEAPIQAGHKRRIGKL